MQRIHDTKKYESVKFEMPESVVRRTICTETGLIATSDACSKRTEYFAEGTIPKKGCPGHAPEAPAEGEANTANTPAPTQ